MIVLSEEKGYTKNQIFYPIPDNSHPGDMGLMLYCDSFIVGKVMEMSLENILIYYFLFKANSFQEWFCRYAQELQDDFYIRMGNVHKQVFL